MKKIKSEVHYKVPSWSFCNLDNQTIQNGIVSKSMCRFCVKKNNTHHCMLHDVPLNYDGTFVEKTQVCKLASVGVHVEILEPEPVQIEPKQLMQMTIDEYNKQISSLVGAGYPYNIAAKLAKQYVLGE